jgi:GTP-binding protein
MKLLDEAAVSYQVVLTKADKISRTSLETLLQKTHTTLKQHTAAYPHIIATSSETGQGIDELRAQAALVARQHAPRD